MLEYVRESLSDGEELIHVGRFHWMYSAMAISNIFLGLLAAILFLILASKIEPFILDQPSTDGLSWLTKIHILHPVTKMISFFIMLFGVYRFAQRMIIKVTTEMAITNARLIYKRGLVSRYVSEINVDRIEGTNVLQGFWGRIFNFGRVMIRGMGVGEVILPPIEDPIKFRKAIDKARNI